MKHLRITSILLMCIGFASIAGIGSLDVVETFAQGGGGGSVNGGGSGSDLPNPIGITDPRELAGRIIKAMLGIVGSIALLVFIYGGFMWVASGGNDEKIQKGKSAIMWASLGLAIIFLSYALVTFVIGAITSPT